MHGSVVLATTDLSFFVIIVIVTPSDFDPRPAFLADLWPRLRLRLFFSFSWYFFSFNFFRVLFFSTEHLRLCTAICRFFLWVSGIQRGRAVHVDGTAPRPGRKPQPRPHRCRGGDVLRGRCAQDRARQLAQQVGRFVGSFVWFSG